MYNNLMINSLLQKQNYTLVVLPHFLIYIVQIVFMNLHHYYVMFEEERNSLITGLASASLLVQLVHEFQQIYKQRQRYFLNFFNLI